MPLRRGGLQDCDGDHFIALADFVIESRPPLSSLSSGFAGLRPMVCRHPVAAIGPPGPEKPRQCFRDARDQLFFLDTLFVCGRNWDQSIQVCGRALCFLLRHRRGKRRPCFRRESLRYTNPYLTSSDTHHTVVGPSFQMRRRIRTGSITGEFPDKSSKTLS
jgi:hypothetical protein